MEKNSIADKQKKLGHLIHEMGKVAIAFSGGTDSTLLMAVAAKVLGSNAVALTVKSPYIPDWEIQEAIELAQKVGIKHEIITAGIPREIGDNPTDRCYLCKHKVFSLLKEQAKQLGIQTIADGTNADDSKDYRPGLRALKELQVRSPLQEAELTKADIRILSKQMGLDTWDKPPYACLLTRLPHDTLVTDDLLSRIEQAETYLIRNGFKAIRVRTHGDTARIEADPSLLAGLVAEPFRSQMVQKFKELGYRFVTLDLEGYRMGVFNPK